MRARFTFAPAAPVGVLEPVVVDAHVASPGEVLKRCADVAVAVVLLVLTAPVVAAAAVLVRLSSPGPVFYSQQRLGRFGRPFWIYKIRSMRNDCERHTGPVWAQRNDPRVTTIGRVLRALHIDELPQLFNVIRGDMSLVGPRPERPGIAADLEQDIPGFADRVLVRPGVTGLAQVQFPPDTDVGSVCRKLVADLTYVDAAGPVLDARILITTVLHVFHMPMSWRRLVLGRHAEPQPDEATSLSGRLSGIYAVPEKPGRIVAVQGLRGVAATLVFVAHFLTLFGVYLGDAATSQAVRGVDAVSRVGTDVFLLIGGFLIYGMVIRKPLAYGPFLAARLRRIYPPFLCVLGLYLLLFLAFPARSKFPGDPAAAALYLLQNLLLLPGLIGVEPIIVVTWTLGYELALYATVPLLVGVMGMRRWPSAVRLGFLVAAWAGYLAYCGLAAPTQARVSVFFAAFIAYELAGRGRTVSAAGRTLGAMTAAVGLAAVVMVRTSGGVPAVDGIPGLASVVRAVATGASLIGLVACCFGTTGVCVRLLSWAPLQWLGNMSYSFYLTHGLVLNAAALAASAASHTITGPAVFWLALPVSYLAALALSTVFFAVVERMLFQTAGDRTPSPTPHTA